MLGYLNFFFCGSNYALPSIKPLLLRLNHSKAYLFMRIFCCLLFWYLFCLAIQIAINKHVALIEYLFARI